MSSPVQNSNSLNHVEGFRYQSPVIGIGASGYDTDNIFIPSLKLNVSDCGDASRTKKGLISKEKMRVMDLYLEQCNRGNRTFNEDEFSKLRDEAQEAKEKVQVPLSLANEINRLLEERIACEDKIKSIDALIGNLSKKLFASSSTS